MQNPVRISIFMSPTESRRYMEKLLFGRPLLPERRIHTLLRWLRHQTLRGRRAPCVLAYTETTLASGASLHHPFISFSCTTCLQAIFIFSSLFFTSIQDHPLFLKGLGSIDVILNRFCAWSGVFRFNLPVVLLHLHVFLFLCVFMCVCVCVCGEKKAKKRRDQHWCLIFLRSPERLFPLCIGCLNLWELWNSVKYLKIFNSLSGHNLFLY